MSTIEELTARSDKLFVLTSARHAELADATTELLDLYNGLLEAFFPIIEEYWERGSFPNPELPLDEYVKLIDKVTAKGTEVIQISRPVARTMGDAGTASLSRLMANVARARQIVEQSRRQQGVADTPSNDALLRLAQSHQPPQSWYEQPEEDLF